MKEQSCATDHTKKMMQTADHSPAALSANLETVPSWFRRVRAAEVSSVRASSSLALKNVSRGKVDKIVRTVVEFRLSVFSGD